MGEPGVSQTALPAVLSRIGINTPAEALLVAPVSYTNFSVPITVMPVPNLDEPSFMRVLVRSLDVHGKGGEKLTDPKDESGRRVSGTVLDELGNEARFVAFRTMSAWRKIHPGRDIHLYGRMTIEGRMRSFYDVDLVASEVVGTIVPVYSGKAGLISGESVAKGVVAAAGSVCDAAALILSRTGLSRDEFVRICAMTPEQLLQGLHWPKNMREATVALAAARKISIRAVYEHVRRVRAGIHDANSALAVTLDDAVVRTAALLARLPFALTRDQRRAIWEILQDLTSEKVMRRLLSGDVGTGKSVVFLTIAALAVLSGKSVAIIAPNSLLVQQLAGELNSYYPEVNSAVVIAGRKIDHDAFEQAGVFFGTTALLNAAEAAGKTFFMVVVDEQQKFSVDQREALLDLGGNLLESTATAIPRTVALVAMGADVSVLRESPVQKKIRSRIVTPAQQRDLIGFVRQQIDLGYQAVVIYPLVESGGKRAIGKDGRDRSLQAAAVRFSTMFGKRLGVLHGKLKKNEKQPVLDKMKAGELDILLASSIIEIGVTLPSLRVAVVVDPEFFGVSQLHQIRGRLARNGGVGFFFMLDADGSLKGESLARMKLLEQCSDGFVLAARDAEARGRGEVFSQDGKQSGDTSSLFFGISLSYNEVEKVAMEALSFSATSSNESAQSMNRVVAIANTHA